MSITETERFRLHQHFNETMGAELASTMMDCLPPLGWGDIATKQDIGGVRQEIEGLRLATKQDIGGVRQEIEGLRLATKQDIGGVRQEIEGLRLATKQDLSREIDVLRKQDIAGIRHEIEGLRLATKQDIGGVRQEIAHLGELVDAKLVGFDAKFVGFDAKLEAMGNGLKAEFQKGLRLQFIGLVMVMPIIQGLTQALSRHL